MSNQKTNQEESLQGLAQDDRKMKTMRSSLFQAAVLVMVLVVALSGCTIGGSTSTSTPTATSSSSTPAVTTNCSSSTPTATSSSSTPTATSSSSTSAAGGPLTGDLCQVPSQLQCVQEENNAPWYPTLVNTEAHDSQRTTNFPCATFGGSLSNPSSNQVFAYTSPAYPSGGLILTRGPSEMYLYGGSIAPASGSYVSRISIGTMNALWTTTLQNTNVMGTWQVSGAAEVLSDGNIVVSVGTYLYKVNSTDGSIMKILQLPTGKSAPQDTNFDGLSGFADGTLVLKSQNRAPGCTIQGAAALSSCPNASTTTPLSVIVAVNPNTWTVIDWIEMPGSVQGRNSCTTFNGGDYCYVASTTQVMRFKYANKKLSLDTSWGPVSYVQPGQTGGSAPVILGNWVVQNTNTSPSKVPLSIGVINQGDTTKIQRIQPMPIPPGGASYIPDKPTVDVENNRIYMQDLGAAQIAAIDLNPTTGALSTAWDVQQQTGQYVTLIGNKDNRIVVASSIKGLTQQNSANCGYSEQMVWRIAKTGQVVASSRPLSALAVGILPTPGYGGLIYAFQCNGHITALQVASLS